MKYFFDTEFIESGPHRPIDLISIGMVSEDGRELYLVSNEFDPNNCSEWVKDNVLINLGNSEAHSLQFIARAILLFIGEDKEPEFWAYYADYDWVVFCQIFGTMMDLPKGWPMYCRDFKQLIGRTKIPIQKSTEHNALEDAKWVKESYQFYTKLL